MCWLSTTRSVTHPWGVSRSVTVQGVPRGQSPSTKDNRMFTSQGSGLTLIPSKENMRGTYVIKWVWWIGELAGSLPATSHSWIHLGSIRQDSWADYSVISDLLVSRRFILHVPQHPSRTLILFEIDVTDYVWNKVFLSSTYHNFMHKRESRVYALSTEHECFKYHFSVQYNVYCERLQDSDFDHIDYLLDASILSQIYIDITYILKGQS